MNQPNNQVTINENEGIFYYDIEDYADLDGRVPVGRGASELSATKAAANRLDKLAKMAWLQYEKLSGGVHK